MDASAIAAWYAALQAALHTSAVTAVPQGTATWGSGTTWVPPTWYRATTDDVASWNIPGWDVLGVATVVAAALIGTATLMAKAQPETLSAAEEEAIRAKNAGEPYDKATYNRARKKQIKNEKYAKERNKRKREE